MEKEIVEMHIKFCAMSLCIGEYLKVKAHICIIITKIYVVAVSFYVVCSDDI